MIEQQRQLFMRKYELKSIGHIYGRSSQIEDVLNIAAINEIKMRRISRLEPMSISRLNSLLDHVEIFELTKVARKQSPFSNRILIATCQPYGIVSSHYAEITELCTGYGCGIFDESDLSWWMPPSTRLFVVAPLNWLTWKGIGHP